MTQLRQKMLEELQRLDYSYRTANTYIRIVRDFAAYFHKPPDKLGPEHIRQYQAYLFQSKKLSSASVSQYVSALRFLYVKTLRRHFLTEYIPFPKSPRRLPLVLSSEEVTRLIDAARNLYHRALLMTLYSTAVRRSELCRLKVSDIDSQRMMIRIHGKGRRDRAVPLSPNLQQTLRLYWRWRKPKTYLFPGRGQRAERPHLRQHGLAGLSSGSPASRHRQTLVSPQSAPQLRHTSTGRRSRLAHHPGPARTLPPGTHSGLPASLPQTLAGGSQSTR